MVCTCMVHGTRVKLLKYCYDKRILQSGKTGKKKKFNFHPERWQLIAGPWDEMNHPVRVLLQFRIPIHFTYMSPNNILSVHTYTNSFDSN